MEPQYRVLRAFAFLLLIAGLLAILFGVVGGLVIRNTPDYMAIAAGMPTAGPPDTARAFAVFVEGAATGIGLILLSQFINLLLGIERNTRASAMALQRLSERRNSRPGTD